MAIQEDFQRVYNKKKFEFERKEYFLKQNLENGRMLFRISSYLVPLVKANYPSLYRRKGKTLACSFCPLVTPVSVSTSVTQEAGQEVQSQPLHSQTHIETMCSLVSDLRAECPPIDDRSLVELYRRIVARHMQLEEFI